MKTSSRSFFTFGLSTLLLAVFSFTAQAGRPLNRGGNCNNNAACNDNNPCTDDVCANNPPGPAPGTCVYTNNSAACDDTLFCTTGDACSGGVCAGGGPTCPFCDDVNDVCNCTEDADCDDGLFCTGKDTCDTGTLVCIAGINPCNSAQVCNETTDTCDPEPCAFAAQCNDGNPCTDDACAEGFCLNVPNASTCDDDLFCNGTDTCVEGGCYRHSGDPCPGQVCDEVNDICACSVDADCNDDNVCTDDFCIGGLCQNTPVADGTGCDDGLFCTLTDACAAGTCAGSGDPCPGQDCDDDRDRCICNVDAQCDDTNPCTDDTCDGVTGDCFYTSNTAACDDTLFCTTGDFCAEGFCVGGGPTCQFCDDVNDVCNCIEDADCDDGLFCTGKDTCDPGTLVCAVGPNPCSPAQVCNETSDVCEPKPCTFSVQCNDDNRCTNDACVDGFCQNVPNAATCDDDLFCNGTDTCAEGGCYLHSGNPCPGQVCDEDNDLCACDDEGDCNDNNLCTGDACIGGTCQNTPLADGTGCDDGLFCTLTDACAAGTCAGSGDPCQGLSCNEENDTCGEFPCTSTVQCNDGNPCTDDACVAGFCQSIPNTAACDDDLFCNGTDTCADGRCSIHSGNPCPSQICNEDNDICVCTVDADCDDDNVCTDDACIDTACQNTPVAEGTGCDDGLFCTLTDACVAGTCDGTGDPCPGQGCDDDRDRCICNVDAQCDDTNPCTDDTCDTVTGDCFNTPNTATCDDTFFCTTGDSCSDGTCVGGGPTCPFCDDVNDVCNCTEDVDCDDFLFCTGPETCDTGTLICTAGTDPCNSAQVCNETTDTCDPAPCMLSIQCNDRNRCTNDACVGGLCQNVPNTATCDDDLFCNGTDTCADGSCSIHAGDPCTAFEVCDEPTDTCVATVPGDLDGDGDVDNDDLALFVACMSGPDPRVSPPIGCTDEIFSNADLDGDKDVDMTDFAGFQSAFDGGE